jgi:hypothetical protein
MKHTIFFKNWKGEWESSPLPATKENLQKVRKELALNGKADIFKK